MSVYFVYRSHYEGPSGKHVKRFDGESVLDWFRHHWTAIADRDKADAHAQKLLGCRVYSFGGLFEGIAQENVAPPRTMKELAARLQDHLYVNELRYGPHAIQIYTDDDELEMAIYFFDDEYLTQHPARAAFLTHGEWAVPATALDGEFRTAERAKELKPRGRGDGTTYAAFNTFYASDNLDYFTSPIRFKGVRLPDLARHLLAAEPKDEEWPGELAAVRTSLQEVKAPRGETAFLDALRDDPQDDATWQVYSDWLEERGHQPAGLHLLRLALAAVPVDTEALGDEGNPKKSKVKVEAHVAQLCLHVARWAIRGDTDLYHQYFFFDDHWAAAHPDLASSLLRYAGRWDVL